MLLSAEARLRAFGTNRAPFPLIAALRVLSCLVVHLGEKAPPEAIPKETAGTESQRNWAVG